MCFFISLEPIVKRWFSFNFPQNKYNLAYLLHWTFYYEHENVDKKNNICLTGADCGNAKDKEGNDEAAKRRKTHLIFYNLLGQ